MKYEYKYIKFNPTLLEWLWAEWWKLNCIYEGTMYLSKEIKKTINITIDEPTTEWEEFIKEYRTINNNWSYANTLIKKYHKTLELIKHKDMMDKLKEYKQHLEVFTTKSPLQVGTFLNQSRWKDTYEIARVNFEDKWQLDLLKELKVPEEYVELIIWERDKWKSMHTTKEVTRYVFEEMIKKYYINN